LTASWGSLSASAYGWQYLFQAGRLDAKSGEYIFEHRDYSTTLGRWMEVDLLGFAAQDEDLYRFLGNSPSEGVDWEGTQEQKQKTVEEMLNEAFPPPHWDNGPTVELPPGWYKRVPPSGTKTIWNIWEPTRVSLPNGSTVDITGNPTGVGTVWKNHEIIGLTWKWGNIVPSAPTLFDPPDLGRAGNKNDILKDLWNFNKNIIQGNPPWGPPWPPNNGPNDK
jgi:RHS repeat-associated protein